MKIELWNQLCHQNQVGGLAGCFYKNGETRHFYYGKTADGDMITSHTDFKVGALGQWIKSLAAIRYCFLNNVDLTKTDKRHKISLLELMRTNEHAFDTQMTCLSGMDVDARVHTFLTRPLYLNHTRLEKGVLITTPLAYSTLLHMLATALSGQSRFITHGMIGALFTPTPLAGLSCNEQGCFGLTDSGFDFAVGFSMDVKCRYAAVLMSHNPSTQPIIERILKDIC